MPGQKKKEMKKICEERNRLPLMVTHNNSVRINSVKAKWRQNRQNHELIYYAEADVKLRVLS